MRSRRTSAAPIWRCRSSGWRRSAAASLQRIGLSATQKPIEEVARFLVGRRTRGRAARDCTIVDTGHRRAPRSRHRMPASPLEAVMSAEVWDQVYDRLTELIEEPSHDAGLRQHPPAGRAGDAPALRTSGRGACRRPSRQPRQRAAPRRRAAAEARRAEGAGRDRVAGARHRHRRCRSRLPDRLAALHRELPAAGRALRPCGRRHAQGPAVSAVARRAGGMRGAARQRRARRARPADDPRAAARRAGAADRRRGRRAGMGRGRASRAVPPRLALSRSGARGFRRRRRDAGRRLHHAARPARRADPSRCGQPQCCAAGAARG